MSRYTQLCYRYALVTVYQSKSYYYWPYQLLAVCAVPPSALTSQPATPGSLLQTLGGGPHCCRWSSWPFICSRQYDSRYPPTQLARPGLSAVSNCPMSDTTTSNIHRATDPLNLGEIGTIPRDCILCTVNESITGCVSTESIELSFNC